jgi:hypothetical protein
LNYFYKISLRIPTILVRDFSRFEVERNYDETGKRFFLDFLRFGGGRGLRARGPYFHTHTPMHYPAFAHQCITPH